MNRKVVGSFVAVLLAAAGTFILLAYVKAAEDRALAGERVANVYVIRSLVPQGTRAEDLGERVELEKVPAKVLAAGGVSDLADLEGKVASVDLVPGEQVVEARFQSPAEVAAAGAVKVPEGLQEVTVPLSAERAAGGRIAPGDTVGIVASFDPFDISGAQGGDGEGSEEGEKTPNTTHMIMHKVLVTAIAGGVPQPESEEGKAAERNGSPGETYLVTLAVEANAVEKIVFTAEFGSLWLSAEPDSAAEEPTQIETRGTVYE